MATAGELIEMGFSAHEVQRVLDETPGCTLEQAVERLLGGPGDSRKPSRRYAFWISLISEVQICVDFRFGRRTSGGGARAAALDRARHRPGGGAHTYFDRELGNCNL